MRTTSAWAAVWLAVGALAPAAQAATCAYLTSLPLSVVDTATHQVVDTIALPGATNVRGVALAPDGQRAYVTEYSGSVFVIDTTTRTFVEQVPTVRSTIGVAVTPNGAEVWAANFIHPGEVSVIDTATNEVSNFGVTTPHNIAFSPDGVRAYVTNTGNFVSVIDVATRTGLGTIPVASTGTRGVAVTPDGTRAYVSLFDSDQVAVIDTATNTVLTNVPVGSDPDEGLAIAPDGASVYVNNSGDGTVSVISTASNTVVATIPVGAFPNNLAFAPDGSFAYVPGLAGTTSVIDTATLSVVDTIDVGASDIAIGNVPVDCGGTATPTITATATITGTATASATPTPTPLCAVTPQGGCRTAARGSFRLKQRGTALDKLLWRWSRGTATSSTEFADPTTVADYALCLYAGASGAPIGQLVIPRGAGGWRSVGSGFTYRDAAASEDGITKALLKASPRNASKILVKGKGLGLPALPLPISPPLVVQLVNGSTGICWGAEYGGAELLTNDADELRGTE